MPDISVIVPVYNVSDYLEWCFESLQDQTLEDIEIIAVNDGSTDDSLEKLHAIAEKDPRIVIVNKKNGGLSSARNAGILVANAPIVCFLDSDDRFTPNTCMRIKQTFEGFDDDVPVDVVTFGANCYPSEAGYPWLEEHLSPRNVQYSPFHPNLIFKEMSRPFAWRTACRSEFLKENDLLFDESVRFGEDQVFHFEIYPRSKNTVLISDKLYDYRLSREGSLMSTMSLDMPAKMLEHLNIMKVIFADWKRAGFLSQYYSEMAEWTIEFMLYDSLGLQDPDRETVLAQARSFLLKYFDVDEVSRFDIGKASKAILLDVMRGKRISNRESFILRIRYYKQQYGYMSMFRSLIRRIKG